MWLLCSISDTGMERLPRIGTAYRRITFQISHAATARATTFAPQIAGTGGAFPLFA
jgi:hypothetical protein